VSEKAVDPEVLAALLDGKLTDKERESVLERLSQSPEAFETFAEAAAVLRDLDPEARGGATPAPDPQVVPLPKPKARPSPPRWMRVWLPIAAVLAGVLLVPRIMNRSANPSEQLVALLDGATLVQGGGDGSLSKALGADWDQPGWSVFRGDRVSSVRRQHEFRAGVRLVDFERALDANDVRAVSAIAPELVAVLGQLEGSGAVVAEYTPATQPEGARSFSSGRERARGRLIEFLGDSPFFDLGLWVEQARLAALANRPAFFDARVARGLSQVIDRLAADSTGNASTLGHLRTLQRLMSDATVDLTAVRGILISIIRENGG
jgi:hypothetical protein